MANTISTSVNEAGTSVKLDPAVLDVWSREVQFAAQPILRFNQVATVKTELTANPGHTIKMVKYDALTGSDSLTENTDMEKGNISTNEISIKVSERGKAVAVSEFLLRTSFLNIMRDTTTLLGRHMAVSIDSLLKWTLFGYGDLVVDDSNLQNTTAVSNTVLSNNRSATNLLTASDYLDTDMIREMAVKLAESKAPKFGGDAYICYAHPQQLKELRRDPAWINAQNYATPDNILMGEVGRYEDVRFIETTMVPYIPAGTQNLYEDGSDSGYDDTDFTQNANTNVYQCVMVGENCLGLAVALPGQLRDDGVEDFGRKHSLAWYGIWGSGIIDAAHGVVGYTAGA